MISQMIAPTRLLFFLSMVGLSIAGLHSGDQALQVVKTDAGPVSGSFDNTTGINVFKGIPFAAAPVGNLRWKAPQPVQHWKAVRACTTFAASPMQPKPVPFSMWSQEYLIPEAPINEDCLYLNVYTGAAAPMEKRPVLVWIYGGGFSSGGSAVPIYDGTAMAKKGIVFVSINYRVGIFGFFSHPELSKEAESHASGNYGLLDQVAALRWVKKNIAAFGGDPDNVTIAGQSAGSMSVNCLVASPLAKNLFKKAIAESGASFLSSTFRVSGGLQDAEKEGEKLVADFKVHSIAEMRNIPAAFLLEKAKVQTRPIVDGYVLPESIAAIFAAHKENQVSLLTGWNQDEGLIFGPLKSAADFNKEAEKQYGADAKTFLQYYPGPSDSEARIAQMNLSRDMIFGAQNYTWARLQSQHGASVFVYRFLRKVPGTGEYAKYGAFHTGEVPYAYDNLKFVNRPWQPVDAELASTMSSYWANFAAKGDPNGPGLPQWPAFNTADKRIMMLDMQCKAQALPDAAALDFLIDKMQNK